MSQESYDAYNKAREIILDIRRGTISQDQVLRIIEKIVESHSDVLVEARNSILGIEKTVAGFLRNGQKIYAIKFYRQATGADLREAKAAIDEMERKLDADL